MTRLLTAGLAGAVTALTLISSSAFAQMTTPTIDVPDQALTISQTISHSTAATSTPTHRYYHRRHHSSRSSSRSSVRSLPSRGGNFGVPETAATNYRLATVTVDTSEIRASRMAANRILSIIHKGQNLAISGETATDYALHAPPPL